MFQDTINLLLVPSGVRIIDLGSSGSSEIITLLIIIRDRIKHPTYAKI